MSSLVSTEKEKRLHRCCFTGHRPEKLFQAPEEVQLWLAEQIGAAVADGFLTFITGMAMGVDIWAGEIVLRMRETDPRLHLIAVVPWPGFSARWKAEWKQRYSDVIGRADLVRYVSRTFNPSVFTKRNTWMVDHSARLIGFYNGADGGTRETIEYARRQGVQVIVGGEKPSEGEDVSDDAENNTKGNPVSRREYPNIPEKTSAAIVEHLKSTPVS